MYLLITVVEREILVEQFKTYEAARAQMLKELYEFGRIDPADCTESETECDEEFGYGQWTAYVNNGVNHNNYDWRIVSLQSLSKKSIIKY